MKLQDLYAENVEVFRSVVSKERYDIAILDAAVEISAAIRRDQTLKTLPVVFIIGWFGLDVLSRSPLEKLAAAGITRGCNPPTNDRFCPNDPVTRGQMAAFLTRALELLAATGIDFTDDDGSIFEDAIERLAAAGITRGCNPPANDRFCPDQPVTRGQMAAFLRRALAHG